jgi:hypothetical protein
MHLPERVPPADAEAVRSFENYQVIADIANTDKHVVRTVQNRQADLATRAMFIVTSSGNFRFVRNQIVATCPAWGELDAVEALGSFVNQGIRYFKFNNENTLEVSVKAGPEQHVATLRAAPQSLPLEGMALYFVEPTPEGGFRAVDPAELRFAVIADPELEGVLTNLGK